MQRQRDPNRGTIANPNQFHVFTCDEGKLPGYVPQRVRQMVDNHLCFGDHHFGGHGGL